MQKVNDTESTQEIEMRDTTATTPDNLIREEEAAGLLPAQSGWRCYWKRCMFLAMLVICSTMLGITINAQLNNGIISNEPDPDTFNFWVYCPVSYLKEFS